MGGTSQVVLHELYAACGDWLAWLCAAGLPILALAGRRWRDKPQGGAGRT